MAGVSIVLDFTVCQGSFVLEVHQRFDAKAVALFGPSGAGKTTVLNSIAGLCRPTSGAIEVGGHVLFNSDRNLDLRPHARRIGYVPQDVVLFPHMSVRKNISYGTGRGAPTSLDTVLRLLELSPLVDRGVAGLSGGERQRVAIARALMSGPDLLLLDEPLAAIEYSLRERILLYIERVRDDLRTPLIYVSHSLDEVERIADRLITIEQGRVVASTTGLLSADRRAPYDRPTSSVVRSS
jgi:molybdate transport system ATP-binding protein